jgi:hypothetical protein
MANQQDTMKRLKAASAKAHELAEQETNPAVLALRLASLGVLEKELYFLGKSEDPDAAKAAYYRGRAESYADVGILVNSHLAIIDGFSRG